MKVEYDYSSLHWRNMEKELQEELDARSDEEKERDRIAAERELEELYRIMDEVNEREQKTVRIVDVEKAVNFQRVVETLKRSVPRKPVNAKRSAWRRRKRRLKSANVWPLKRRESNVSVPLRLKKNVFPSPVRKTAMSLLCLSMTTRMMIPSTNKDVQYDAFS